MNRLEKAASDTAHDFGVPELVKHMPTTKSQYAFYKKLDPEQDRNHLRLDEALAMMLITKDYRILYAMAAETGHAVFPLGDFSDCSDVELITKITELGMARGDVDREIHEALDDGKIRPHERDKIQAQIHAAIRANLELLTRIDALTVAESSGSRTAELKILGKAESGA